MPGLVFMNGKEWDVAVQNLSITGVLIQIGLNEQHDIQQLIATLSTSIIVDLYIPELRLACEAEVVRANTSDDGNVELALEFKSVTHCIEKWQYKRKAYRKVLSDIGRILLDGKCHEFISVNASVDGLMVRLPATVAVREGTIAPFEFKRLALKGKVKVIWVDALSDSGTFLGLQYLNIEKEAIKNLPDFPG